MTEYCRLCAEPKYHSDFATSIDDIEQLMEQKLRACCQWTTENTGHRLPHSVCSICLDKLNNCWLFSQSVQLAQRRLLEIFGNESEIEIETKPYIIEIFPEEYDSSEYSKSLPLVANVQSDRFNQQSVGGQRKQKPNHSCEICSHEFSTVDELNAHRQQGCEGLIEIESNIADYKPSAVDFIEPESDMDTWDNQRISDDDDSSDATEEQSTKSECNANRRGGKKSFEKAAPQSHNISDQTVHTSLNSKQKQEQSNEQFICPLCNDVLATDRSLKRHLIGHVNHSNGQLKIDGTNEKTHIIQTNGGDPIYLGLKIYKCAKCNQMFDQKYYLLRHTEKRKCRVHTKRHWTISEKPSVVDFTEPRSDGDSSNRRGQEKLDGKALHSYDIRGRDVRTSLNSKQHVGIYASTKKGPFKCQLCDHKEFTANRSLKRHLIGHVNHSNGQLKIDETNNKPRIIQINGGDPIDLGPNIYRCAECDRIFDQKYDLKEHLKTHTKKQPFDGYRQTGKRDSTIGDKSLVVNSTEPEIDDGGSNVIDLQSTSPISDANQYEQKKSDGEAASEKPYNCEKRDGTGHSWDIKSSRVVTGHQVVHASTKKGPFKCQLCDKGLARRHSLRHHLIAHVNNSKGELKLDVTDNGPRIIQTNGGDPIYFGSKLYKCAECDQIFHQKHLLRKHLIKHTEKQKIVDYKQTGDHERPYKCPLCECDNSFARKPNLRDHLVNHVLRSKGALKIEKINRKSKKPIFQIVQANGDGGSDPIFIPGKVELFKCEECDQSFTSKHNLNKHLVSHTIERPFECWLCHKTFKTKYGTKKHLNIHVPGAYERKWICELCGRAFVSNLALSNHMQSAHSNERPYKCEICGSGYKVKAILKAHHLSHLDAQHRCNECHKAFKSKHSLKMHLETHTGVVTKPHVCDFCGKGFRTNAELKDHRSMHTGEKRFKCDQCGSNFGAKSSFHTHMRKVHGTSLLAQKKEKMSK